MNGVDFNKARELKLGGPGPNEVVVESLKQLLKQAEDGEIHSVLCIALLHENKTKNIVHAITPDALVQFLGEGVALADDMSQMLRNTRIQAAQQAAAQAPKPNA